jgi:putative heme-binding domain-containing protein
MPRGFLRSTLILLAIAGPMTLPGRLQAQTAKSASGSTPDGKRIFETTCVACHGLDGQGGERGPDIVRRREIQRLPDSALRNVIRHGVPGGGMPAFAALGSPKIEAVVRHLRALQGQGNVTRLPGYPESGKTLFFGQAGCSQCHMVGGEGGFMASDLSGYADARPAIDIRSAITDPNRNLDPRRRTVVVTTVDGNTHTGTARNEDNFSLQLQTPDGAFHFFDKADLENIQYQPGSLMPADYGSKLSSKQIDDLVSYLISVGKGKAQSGRDQRSFRHASDECRF